MTRGEKKTVKIRNSTDKKPKGPKKGKYTIRRFNKWLKERGYTILGKECEERKHSGGWPDFIVRKGKKGKIKFFEVKSGRHQVDHHQIKVLNILCQMGGEVSVYRYEGKIKDPKKVMTNKDIKQLAEKIERKEKLVKNRVKNRVSDH